MPPRQKIFFIIPTLTNSGSERVFSLIVNHLDINKFDILLIIIDGRKRFYPIDETKIRVIDLQTRYLMMAFPQFFKLIATEKPDIVISTRTHLNQFIALVKPFLPQKPRYIIRESSILSKFHGQNFLGFIQDSIVRLRYKLFDTVICQSKLMAFDFENNYHLSQNKLKHIQNPVDTEGVILQAQNSIVPLRKARFRFVSIGRLSPEKGFDRALNALALLKNIDFEYIIIGEGEQREMLENHAKMRGIGDKVTLLGLQKNPFGWLASADLFLLTSHFEGFPNVLLEAGAVGTPSITFSCGGVASEIIRENISGIIVEDADERAFAAAILHGCEMPFNRTHIKELTLEKFGLHKIIKQYETLFENK